MRIGVISDTHGLLRPEALDALAGVEHIIHAGDIGSPDIVPRLAMIAPVTPIRGNVDTQPWAQAFPPWEVVTLSDRTIYVIHDLGGAQPQSGGGWHSTLWSPATRTDRRSKPSMASFTSTQVVPVRANSGFRSRLRSSV